MSVSPEEVVRALQLAQQVGPYVWRGGKTAASAIKKVSNAAYNAAVGKKKRAKAGRGKARANGILTLPPEPVSYTYAFRPKAPRMAIGGPDGSMWITHQELFAQSRPPASGVATSFRAEEFLVNPSNPLMFPWLSGIARKFEKFQFDSLSVTHVPFCGTAQRGDWYGCANYDVNDAVPIDNTMLMAQYKPVTQQLYKRATFTFDRARMNYQKTYYVQPTANTADNLVYCARFVSGVQDSSNFSPCGNLIVSYKVKLVTPLGVTGSSEVSTIEASTGLSTGSPFGSSPIINGDISFDILTQTIKLPRVGSYFYFGVITGTGFTPGNLTTPCTYLSANSGLGPGSGVSTIVGASSDAVSGYSEGTVDVVEGPLGLTATWNNASIVISSTKLVFVFLGAQSPAMVRPASVVRRQLELSAQMEALNLKKVDRYRKVDEPEDFTDDDEDLMVVRKRRPHK